MARLIGTRHGGVTSFWPATRPEVATVFMHPGGCGQAAAGVPVGRRGVPQVFGRRWRPQVSEAGLGQVLLWDWMRGRRVSSVTREGREAEGTTLRVGDCWAPAVPGVVGTAPLPALRRGLLAPQLSVGG